MKKTVHAPRFRSSSVLAMRAVIEVASILFLFYSNLLMGEFTASSRPGKTWAFAFRDIFTRKNLGIGFVSALVGFVVFEGLRERTRSGPESSPSVDGSEGSPPG